MMEKLKNYDKKFYNLLKKIYLLPFADDFLFM